jgi:hypothetical protein
MSRSRAAILAALALAGAVTAGCGDDGDVDDAAAGTTGATAETEATEATGATDGTDASDEGTTTSEAGGDADLPPLDTYTIDDISELEQIYGPALAELDLVITRGGVVEFQEGNHLQLYAEPTTPVEANTPQVYLDRMLTSFQAIVPLLFDAYPDLDSFDLCQEVVPDPATATAEAGYEEPVTLFLLTRAGYESVDDWSTATLEDLFAVAGDELDDLGYSEVTPEIAALPDYVAATSG